MYWKSWFKKMVLSSLGDKALNFDLLTIPWIFIYVGITYFPLCWTVLLTLCNTCNWHKTFWCPWCHILAPSAVIYSVAVTLVHNTLKIWKEQSWTYFKIKNKRSKFKNRCGVTLWNVNWILSLGLLWKVEDCSYFRSFHLRDCAEPFPECTTLNNSTCCCSVFQIT